MGLLGLASFLAGWGGVAAHVLRASAAAPREVCRAHLRTLFVASRKISAEDRVPRPALNAVRAVLGETFLVTEDEARYLYPGAEHPMVSYTGPSLEALLCMEDPDFGQSMSLALIRSQDFETSYIWCPKDSILAYCPFHQLTLLRNGWIQEQPREQ